MNNYSFMQVVHQKVSFFYFFLAKCLQISIFLLNFAPKMPQNSRFLRFLR